MAWPAFDDLAVDVVMTTRHGGVSTGGYRSLNLALHVGDDDDRVIHNRGLAAELIGAELGDMVFCNQTHGRGVLRVTASDCGRGSRSVTTAPDGVDAMVTAEVGPALAMMVADCVPIALYDPRSHVAGVVHSGWRGTVLRVAEASVQAMVRLGSSPDDIIAAIGPAIEANKYKVGPEVMKAASVCFRGETADVIHPERGEGTGKYLFDLWEANRRILAESGVSPDRILVAGIPTGGDGPFFSYRDEKHCGRNAMLVSLERRP